MVVSYEGDVHAEAMCWALARLGATPLFINALWPLDRHRWEMSAGNGRPSTIRIDGLEIADDLPVWFRRPFSYAPSDFASLDRDDRKYAERTSELFFHNVQTLLEDRRFCVDPIYRMRRADAKSLQFKIAASVGLATLPSSMTNDPRAAADFVAAQRSVNKAFEPFFWQGDGGKYVNGVALVDHRAVIDAGPTIGQCPVYLQRFQASCDELRVVIIGRNIFCATLGWSNNAGARVDWRGYQDEISPSAWTLPDAVQAALLGMTRALGLHYAAIDLIRSDGTYYFLELNPGGQWLWMDRPEAGLPILDCFARFLSSGDPDYRHHGDPEVSFAQYHSECGEALRKRLVDENDEPTDLKQSIDRILDFGTTEGRPA